MSLAARQGDTLGRHGLSTDVVLAVEALTNPHAATCSTIEQGHARVIIEDAPAACVGHRCDHGDSVVEEGSAKVFIGGRPASRAGDASTCGGRVVSHARKTTIGGPTRTAAAEGPQPIVTASLMFNAEPAAQASQEVFRATVASDAALRRLRDAQANRARAVRDGAGVDEARVEERAAQAWHAVTNPRETAAGIVRFFTPPTAEEREAASLARAGAALAESEGRQASIARWAAAPFSTMTDEGSRVARELTGPLLGDALLGSLAGRAGAMFSRAHPRGETTPPRAPEQGSPPRREDFPSEQAWQEAYFDHYLRDIEPPAPHAAAPPPGGGIPVRNMPGHTISPDDVFLRREAVEWQPMLPQESPWGYPDRPGQMPSQWRAITARELLESYPGGVFLRDPAMAPGDAFIFAVPRGAQPVAPLAPRTWAP